MKKMKLSHKTVLSLVLSAVLLCMPVAAFAMNEGNSISVQAEDLKQEETTSGQDVQNTENATEENATEAATTENAEDSTGETEEGGTVSGNDIAEPVCICEDRCGAYDYDKDCEVCAEDYRECEYKTPNVRITINQPQGWYNDSAKGIICKLSSERKADAGKTVRQRIKKNEKRYDEVNRLIKKLYEDNISGKLSDKRFDVMLKDYEEELSKLENSLEADNTELEEISADKANADLFMELAKKYTDFEELTPAMLNEFVSKIIVHKAEGVGADRTQEVEIFLNYIGKIEIPHEEVELSEEEKKKLEKERIRLEKKRASNRKYMARKREEIRREREKELAEKTI